MSFCPDWVFDIAVATAAMDFLSTEVPIYAVSNKYAEGLSEKYSSITKEQICEPAESLLHFLAEVNAGDEAVTFLNGFDSAGGKAPAIPDLVDLIDDGAGGVAWP